MFGLWGFSVLVVFVFWSGWFDTAFAFACGL